MSKISIFYYTHNLLSPSLLKTTLLSAVEHAKNNDCELIITSHFPLTTEYEENRLIPIDEENYTEDINKATGERFKSHIYDFIVKDLQLDISEPNVKKYVVGKLPYSLTSIFDQIIFSLDNCTGDNIVLMEHDCFYPENYIPTVKKTLDDYQRDFAYCSENYIFLNSEGYFTIPQPIFVLGGCSGKKELFKRIFENKLELIKKNKPHKFEPILDIQNPPPQLKEEILVHNHLCIDKWLGEYHSILDIKHGINTDGFFNGEYKQFHPYWEKASKFINMIKSIKLTDEERKKWGYGISSLNY